MTLDWLEAKFATEWTGVSYLAFVAVSSDNRIAAFYALYPVMMNLSGREVIAAQSGDTMTHPAHRKRGLFLQLAERTYQEAAKQGIVLVFGFPNENSVGGFRNHLNWRFLPDLVTTEFRCGGSWLTHCYQKLRHRSEERVFEHLETVKANDQTSAMSSEANSVVRDAGYLQYKHRIANGVVIEAEGLVVWLKPGRRIDVGAMNGEQDMTSEELAVRLRRIMKMCGAHTMRFTYSADSEPLRKILNIAQVQSRTVAGYLYLGGSEGEVASSDQVADLFFCRGDLDYF